MKYYYRYEYYLIYINTSNDTIINKNFNCTFYKKFIQIMISKINQSKELEKN